MLNVIFNPESFSSPTILCLGAHSDDIEIGCGGTILRLVRDYPQATFHWIVFSSIPERKKEAVESAHIFLEKAGRKEIKVHDFRDGFFPYTGGKIKDMFEDMKAAISPDLILTHTSQDAHQDHRLINELTWNTWRNHMIIEYEVPKYDGDLGRPNFFVHIGRHMAREKVDILMKCFQTQNNRHWFTEDTFLGLMRLRGMESRAPENFAEGFYCRKIVV